MFKIVHTLDDSRCEFTTHLADEEETMKFGSSLGKVLQPGLCLYLSGDLGTGKTTLVRACLRALDVTDRIKSPTYTLVEPYTVSSLHLYHFDFYRFNSPEEFLDAGLDEYFTNTGVCLVEWPDKAAPYLPDADIVIDLVVAGAGRQLQVSGRSEAGKKCVTNLIASLTNTAP